MSPGPSGGRVIDQLVEVGGHPYPTGANAFTRGREHRPGDHIHITAQIAALKRDLKALTSQVRILTNAQEKAEAIAERQQAAQGRSKALAGSQPTQATAEAEGAAGGKGRGGRKFTFSHEALIAKRQSLHLTQKEMARLLGVSVVSVYKWENGPGDAPDCATFARASMA